MCNNCNGLPIDSVSTSSSPSIKIMLDRLSLDIYDSSPPSMISQVYATPYDASPVTDPWYPNSNPNPLPTLSQRLSVYRAMRLEPVPRLCMYLCTQIHTYNSAKEMNKGNRQKKYVHSTPTLDSREFGTCKALSLESVRHQMSAITVVVYVLRKIFNGGVTQWTKTSFEYEPYRKKGPVDRCRSIAEIRDLTPDQANSKQGRSRLHLQSTGPLAAKRQA